MISENFFLFSSSSNIKLSFMSLSLALHTLESLFKSKIKIFYITIYWKVLKNSFLFLEQNVPVPVFLILGHRNFSSTWDGKFSVIVMKSFLSIGWKVLSGKCIYVHCTMLQQENSLSLPSMTESSQEKERT